MRNFLCKVWTNVLGFFKWVSKQKFIKVVLRELLFFIIAFFLVLKFFKLPFFAFFSTFIGAYLISFFTIKWVLMIDKGKNNFLTWVYRGIALFVVYDFGLCVVENVMPKPHDIHYYYAGFISGILGYLISTSIRK